MDINTSKDGWQRSSSCASNACVEVRQAADGEWHVRDAANPEDFMRFSAAEWDAFVAGVQAGEFDPE